MYSLAQETDEDWWEVEALFDLAFAPGREALSSYRLRDGVPPMKTLSRVARDADGILAAAIRYWPVIIETATATRHPAILLGPIAVHPTRQGEGLGGLLINESLAVAKSLGIQRAMLVGDAPYYGKFGFRQLVDVHMPPPTNPERVLGRPLFPGAWDDIAGQVTRA